MSLKAEITCDICGQTITSINDNEVSTLTSFLKWYNDNLV